MKSGLAVALDVVQVFSLSLTLAVAGNASAQASGGVRAAAQNPLAALEAEAKEKAAEAALTKVLNEHLPLTLNAKDVFPTVTTLPGGPFNPTALKLTADQLDQPLPPGDYTINTLDFCSEYSVHQPGAGTAYVLGPYEGKAAGAIGALIWRGTEQYNINASSLQAVSWSIQSGLTYEQMPKSYQAIVDQVIPDFKSQITGDFVTNLESTYSSLAKATNLPPLDTILAKLGEPGQLALDAERERQILTAQNTSDELKQQTLFQGQESGIYTPVSAESGPWTERVKGQVYMKLLIAGGNMATNNVMQIRVMPAPTAMAQVETGGPRLVRTAYGGPQVTPAMDNAPVTLTSIMEGILGYSVGRGAQALGQVAVRIWNAIPPVITPAEAAELPAKPGTPPTAAAQNPPAQSPDAPTPAPAPSGTTAANSASGKVVPCLASAADQPGNPKLPNIHFASCTGAMTSQQLFAAYNTLYLCSKTFRDKMNGIKNEVFVLLVDGKSPLGVTFQSAAGAGYANLVNSNEGAGLDPPPGGAPEDYAYTFLQKSGHIRVDISAQALIYNEYTTGFGAGPYGTMEKDKCGVSGDPQRQALSIQQTLAYELAENVAGYAADPGYKEHPDEDETNTIMTELGAAKGHIFAVNRATDERGGNCTIMSGAAYYDNDRASGYRNSTANGIGIYDYGNQLVFPATPATVAPPKCAVNYDSQTGGEGKIRSCEYPEPANACQTQAGTQ
jgi:hypothetical protein